MSFNHIIVEDYSFIFNISSCVFYNDLDFGNCDRRGRDLQTPSKAGQGKWQGQRVSGQTQVLIARLSGYANNARRDANTGMFAQINKFMTYLCKSCHFENPENIRHKMKRNILFRYSGNFSNIDWGYVRTCPIIDIWPTNPSDRTTFETPSNHLTNKSILIAGTVNSGVTSLCFWQKWGKWSKCCPSNMHSD